MHEHIESTLHACVQEIELDSRGLPVMVMREWPVCLTCRSSFVPKHRKLWPDLRPVHPTIARTEKH